MRDVASVREDLEGWARRADSRVKTGYSWFDRLTGGGVATGELMIVVARSGVGKTWVGLNILANNNSVPSVLFSLEMHGRYALKRLAGIHGATPTFEIEDSLREHGSHPAVDKVMSDFSLLGVDDQPGQNWGGMLGRLDEYESHFGVKPRLVVVDYLELVRGFGPVSGKSEMVSSLATDAKQFAREADVALVVLHQVARGEKVRPEGGGIPRADMGHRPLDATSGKYGGEEAADYLLGCYRPAKDPELDVEGYERLKHDFRIQFLKTRSDFEIPFGSVQHHYDQPTGRIVEIRRRQT